MLAELGNISQIIEISQELEDPRSEVCLEKAIKILDLISNNTAAFYDSSTNCDDTGRFSIFDSVHQEYKLHNGTNIFIVPRSVILGATSEVKKRKYKATSIADEVICIIAQCASLIERLDDSKTKFKWREDNTADIKKA
jgi:tartrate dehydratase alpha subunit/fumarate hydratase class I-like protein